MQKQIVRETEYFSLKYTQSFKNRKYIIREIMKILVLKMKLCQYLLTHAINSNMT